MSREVSRAILKGDIDKLEGLIQQGYDVHNVTEKESWNLLHRALVSVSITPKVDMIKYLIDKGVEVNSVDVYGYTPLHYAARVKSVPVIQCLLQAGADVDPVSEDGETPLRLTFQNHPFSLEAVGLLLMHGANIDHSHNGGTTIYDLAKLVCHEQSDLAIVDLMENRRNVYGKLV
ncbi:ankyrin repeat domain-containing protein [Fulvivirga maritima]|uniref:ankyrin repeat domain-containing protein n=1 Tax=Fulvivirga maritima TaxID=2904247 RepID=UPI001F1B94B5|nr:ankyrin repeat domain-containing protein [Fulvivirga maritima]UII26827.1 ankyrin repeat domain-containing protein [Fulvivirga maritima]